MFLLILLVIYKMVVFFPYLFIWCLYILPFRIYIIWRYTRNEGRGHGPVWMIVFCIFIYPFLVLFRVWVFLFQISLSFYYTGRFYLYVFLCRRRWADAYRCIIRYP